MLKTIYSCCCYRSGNSKCGNSPRVVLEMRSYSGSARFRPRWRTTCCSRGSWRSTRRTSTSRRATSRAARCARRTVATARAKRAAAAWPSGGISVRALPPPLSALTPHLCSSFQPRPQAYKPTTHSAIGMREHCSVVVRVTRVYSAYG